MSNQGCKIRPEIVIINGDDALFYSYSVKISKCSGSCNNINDLCKNVYCWCCLKHKS